MIVTEAKDGKEALELLDDEIDLIILDVMMPEMNGYEATKAIRAMNDRPDGKNIPIIEKKQKICYSIKGK